MTLSPGRRGVVLGALIYAAACAFVGAAARPSAPAAAGPVDFTRQIRPLLSDRCFRCHGPDASRRKAELRLDLREGAFKKLPAGWAIVKPGDPAKSELIRRITTEEIEDAMPPAESHLSLSEDEKALLTRWVAEGADYRPHWSFAPVSTVDSAARRPGSAPLNPDRRVRARPARTGGARARAVRAARGADPPAWPST